MTGSLRVAHLSHLASPQAPTGAETSLALLAEALSQRGHRVTIAHPGPWALEGRLIAGGVALKRVPCRMAWLTQYEEEPAWTTALRFARFAWPDPGRARLEAWLRRDAPDVVHVNCLPHRRGAAAGRAAGRPVVWHVREILPAGWRRRWFAEALDRWAAAVVTVSEATARWIREEGLGHRVTVVPNGVRVPGDGLSREQARSKLGLDPGGCWVALIGQLLLHKGVREFLEAARLAAEEEADLRFLLAGPGPEEILALIDTEADRPPLRGRMTRVPARPDADLLFAAADVVALATTTPDPLPRSVLEAMARGRPVAAFRSGGAEEMVVDGRTGILVGAGDVVGLAASWVRLARDSAAREALGAAGRERASSAFSLDAHARRMESIFREVAGR